MIGKLASVDLSSREEVIIAAAFVERSILSHEYFPEETSRRFEFFTKFLNELPQVWAYEICTKTLAQAALRE